MCFINGKQVANYRNHSIFQSCVAYVKKFEKNS